MNTWLILTICYVVLAFLSFIPTLKAITQKIKLHDGGASFQDSPYFSEEAKKQLAQHESRIQGTLFFWKKEATKYKNFHYYGVIWTILSSTLIPILAQYIDDDPMSKLLITVISSHTALLLAFHRALKVDKNFQAFRQGESEFYDLRRRLLDRPQTFGSTEKKQIELYFDQVETIRKYIRNAETDNFPSLDFIKQQEPPQN